ncbi:MAG TPA: histidine kinase [Pyrinomonadaceae bacterium]|nr:histidine kinase [Pyrinomonadaceae bacterium]
MFELDERAAVRSGGGDWRHGAARLGFIWGLWTLVGLFFSSQIYFYFIRTQKPVPLTRAIAWQVLASWVFAAGTPLVLWLARRFRVERNNWRRRLLVHFAAGTTIAAAWAACHVTLDLWFSGNLSTLTPSNLARLVFANFDKQLLVYCIVVLVSHALDYHQRYREGELRASQAQLQALKMQLHPHFLFNALHSISALVHKDPGAADRMIARLGDFLRLTLDTAAAQEVPLRQELEFLECYLGIERIRFCDRLTTSIDVDPLALNCRVPNLILQPIVENAIRHGIATRSAPGRVEIKAERRGAVLSLQVRDDGPGLTAGARAGKASQTGVGLANTRARLEQLYGADYNFEMADDPRGGTLVTIEIPLRAAGQPAQTTPRAAARPEGSYQPALGK